MTRVKIEVHGHQHGSTHVGDVVAWTQSVEKYSNGQCMQVPAVLLRENDSVVLIPLQSEYRWTKVTVLDDVKVPT